MRQKMNITDENGKTMKKVNQKHEKLKYYKERNSNIFYLNNEKVLGR